MFSKSANEIIEEADHDESIAEGPGTSAGTGGKAGKTDQNMKSTQNIRHSKCFSASPNTAIQRKKRPLHPLMVSNHHPYQPRYGGARLDLNIAAKDNLSSFTQRVMSAKLLRLKQLQNQLAEAHLQLNELCTENRLLRALQKRQDLALDRYEGTQAQLPQLVRSHHEEVRILRTKYKNLKSQFQDTTKTLKERETELQNLREQHAHLLKLSRDRHLGEREALNKQVDTLKGTVDEQAHTIQMLNRKVLLEGKNLKHQLQQEVLRHKATQSELRETLRRMEQLQLQIETQAKDRHAAQVANKRFGRPVLGSQRLPGLKRTDRYPLGPHEDGGQGDCERLSDQRNEHITGDVHRNNFPTTDPSSDQPDSSVATYSDKMNSFTTSLDSTPEHNVEGMSNLTNSLSEQHNLIYNKTVAIPKDGENGGVSIFNLLPNHSSSRDTEKRNTGAPISNLESMISDHKKVLDVITEQPSKREDYEEDIAIALASVDLASGKHAAALANATFAVKDQSSPTILRKQHQSGSSLKLLTGDVSHVFKNKNGKESESSESSSNEVSKRQFSPGKSRKKSITKNTVAAQISERKGHSSTAGDSLESKTELNSEEVHQNRVENNNNTKSVNSFSFLNQSWEELRMKLESEQRNEGVLQNYSATFQENEKDETDSFKYSLEETDLFHKEALLKALQAIDDDAAAHQKNRSDSDESSSELGELRIGSTTIPDRMFMPTNKPTAMSKNHGYGFSFKGKNLK